MVISGILLVAAVVVPTTVRADDLPIDFNQDIRPVLAKNCFACHGPDENDREAGLRLDDRGVAVAELESGSIAIVPQHPQQSELVSRITSSDPDLRMPPADSGHALKPAEIKRIEQWINQGAPFAKHWSFANPVHWPPPDVNQEQWPLTGLDYFVLARMEAHRLQPSEMADRHALIRRLSLDLRGLPPTPHELESFLSDERPDAYGRLVDAFLADPAYGERWARVWLDLARYADSKGYGSDPLRTIWRYRDWVIDALNQNMPYDQFTVEQLAGDLLPDPTFEQRVATAFHRNTMTNTEGGTDDEEFRVAAVRDRVDTTGQIWLGLTMGCAKCHNHKYDPITQKEYYQFYAYFNHTADNDLPTEAPTLKVPVPEISERIAQIDSEVAVLQKQLERLKDEEQSGQDQKPKPKSKRIEQLQKQIDQLKKSKPALPTVPIMQELAGDKRRITKVMIRGNFLTTGDEVHEQTPSAFHEFPEGAPQNRLGIAYWLMSPDNPLTARVAVNRIWARLFGNGLVVTEEDFGTQGELPSHPKLLDWLAVEYMRSDWDTKALLKLIVTSATYRQSSHVTAEAREVDPQNRWLARAPRFRLEAETVRDQAMALSGLLSRKMHGPSVYPPQPPGLWRAAFNGKDRRWATSTGEDRYRRGVYTFWRRTVPYPSMATFDAPSREICVARRIRTNTPLQALVTLNDPVYVEAAQGLARRIMLEGGTSVKQRARWVLQLCLVRIPTDAEIDEIVSLFKSERQHYSAQHEEARTLATKPLGAAPQGLDIADLAAWTVVANILLNHDAVLSKG